MTTTKTSPIWKYLGKSKKQWKKEVGFLSKSEHPFK
jgi:hypothetical protein